MAQEGAIPLEEAALRLGKTPNALRKQAAKGTIYGFKRGGRWYVQWPLPEPKQAPQTSLAKPSETSPNKPTDGEVAYLRDLLRQAGADREAERRRHEQALADERRLRDEAIRAKDEQIKGILVEFRETVTKISEQRQLPAPQPETVVIEPLPEAARRPRWQFWRR